MSQSDPGGSADGLEVLAARALAHHRAGRLDAAEQDYRAILRRQPDNFRMMSNLGVLLSARADFAAALPLLAAASAGEPGNPTTWAAHLNALIAAGEFAGAETALAARADIAPALEAGVRRALARKFAESGQALRGEAHLVRACELSPADPEVHLSLARLRLSLRRPAEALEVLHRALGFAPENLGVLLNLAASHMALDDPGQAETWYRRALSLSPGHSFALRRLRLLLLTQERSAEVLACAEAALAVGVDEAEVHTSRGAALLDLGEVQAALAAFARALDLGGDRYELLIEIGRAEAARGAYPQALAALDAAVALQPDMPRGRMRRALIRLLTQDFAGGWADYEHRWRDEDFLKTAGAWAPRVLERLTLDPRPAAVAGRRVLCVSEQGIGDQVMFASMLPDLARQAAEITCLCEPRLLRLFTASFPEVRFEPMGRPLPGEAFDTLVAMGSLGGLYRPSREAFPAVPYLRPGEEARTRWSARLGPRAGRLRIGLSWRGGTGRTRASRRSMSLDDLAPLLDLPGCEFVSLQYGDVAAELAAANTGRANPIRVFPAADIDDFKDLAALVGALDVVVSVQTSLVHLAGALGTEALVLLPRQPEWRYGAAGPAMPWYGSVRLHRQGPEREWKPVVAEVAAVLGGRLT